MDSVSSKQTQWSNWSTNNHKAGYEWEWKWMRETLCKGREKCNLKCTCHRHNQKVTWKNSCTSRGTVAAFISMSLLSIQPKESNAEKCTTFSLFSLSSALVKCQLPKLALHDICTGGERHRKEKWKKKAGTKGENVCSSELIVLGVWPFVERRKGATSGESLAPYSL